MFPEKLKKKQKAKKNPKTPANTPGWGGGEPVPSFSGSIFW